MLYPPFRLTAKQAPKRNKAQNSSRHYGREPLRPCPHLVIIGGDSKGREQERIVQCYMYNAVTQVSY